MKRQAISDYIQFRLSEEEGVGQSSICLVDYDQQAQHPGEIQKLMNEYEDLFRELKTLPPTRLFDHSIHLLLRATLVNIKSYRYSLAKKDEIEKQL